MEMVQMEFWTTSRIIILAGSCVNAPRGIPTFPIHFWIMFHCTDDKLPQTKNMLLRGGTEGSKHRFQPVILCFGSFFKSYKRKKLLSEWELNKMKMATNLLHKEDTLIATSLSSELLKTSQIVKELFKKYSS